MTSIISRAAGLQLAPCDTQLSLDTRLFHRWGPLLRSLRLSQEWYRKPEIPSFLAKAGNLQRLHLLCNNVLTAAQAGFLMSHSCAKEIIIDGWYMPGIFPAGLSHLSIHFPAYNFQRDDSHALRTPNALIYSLAFQQHLTCLALHFACGPIALSCPIQLPELDIHLHFSVGIYLYHDLSWLSRQPCRVLHIHLTIKSPGLEANMTMVEELRTLPISKLTLHIGVSLPPHIQHLWQTVAVSQRCTLHVEGFLDYKDGHALCFLPRCPEISIHARDIPRPTGLAVLWSAVTSQPGRVLFRLGSHQCLSFTEGCAMPEHLVGQAWQLVVHSAAEVQGLPALRRRAGVQYLQTPAAELEGWTVP